MTDGGFRVGDDSLRWPAKAETARLVWGVGCGVKGAGCRVKGAVCEVHGVGCRV